MNKIYMIIFLTTIFSLIYTVQAFGESTSTISQDEINKLLNDEYQKTPLSGEVNLYSILTIFVVSAVIILKFVLTNSTLLGAQKKTELYKEYEQDTREHKAGYAEWSEERIADLKLEVKEQKKILDALQNEVNKVVLDMKNSKDLLVSVKDDVKDIKDGIRCIKVDTKEHKDILSDLEIKIAVMERLSNRRTNGSGGGS